MSTIIHSTDKRLLSKRQTRLQSNRTVRPELVSHKWNHPSRLSVMQDTNRPGKQSGAVLAISLIMLLLLTIVGVTAMQTTGLEEKMAGNMRDRNIAFQAAESALRAGENILTQATLPDFTATGTNGLYDINGNPPGTYDSWANNTATYAAASDQAAEDPRYVIQRMANVASGDSLDAGAYGQSEMYRVTARGVGGTATAVAVVQSTYKR